MVEIKEGPNCLAVGRFQRVLSFGSSRHTQIETLELALSNPPLRSTDSNGTAIPSSPFSLTTAPSALLNGLFYYIWDLGKCRSLFKTLATLQAAAAAGAGISSAADRNLLLLCTVPQYDRINTFPSSSVSCLLSLAFFPLTSRTLSGFMCRVHVPIWPVQSYFPLPSLCISLRPTFSPTLQSLWFQK